MKEFRIGIVGLGSVATAHLHAYQLLKNVSIVSVCDMQLEKVTSTAEQLDARPYTDYRQLLADGGIDLVLVLTPASSHREIVEAAAREKIHVLCEKPLAVTLEDAESMVRECRNAGVKLFYGSCYRYLPAVKKAYELINSGVIGKIQLMTEQVVGGKGFDAYRELPPSHYPLEGPGGHGMGLMDHGIHLVDIFSWFTGSDIIRVQGRGQISGAPAHSEYMVMQFADNEIGHLIYNPATYSSCLPAEGVFSEGNSWQDNGELSTPNHWENEPGYICVYGTAGSLRIFYYANALYVNNGEGMRRIELDGRPAFGHFATQLEDCAQAIMEEKKPSISGDDGLRALKSVLEVYR